MAQLPTVLKVIGDIDILESSTCALQYMEKFCSLAKQEEAIYILDIGDLVKKYEIWKEFLPRITPYYAVKCNSCLPVLQTLAHIGVNFDCASKEEIDQIISIGVSPERIIYANPVKYLQHIPYAYTTGVTTMTFDNEEELWKVKNLHPNAKMILRFKCDAKIRLGPPFGEKFGCDPTDGRQLLQLAKDWQVDVVGVCFHVSTSCGESNVFRRALEHAKDLITIAKEIGHHITLLDIGGGFPGKVNALFMEIVAVLNKTIDDFFPNSTIKIIAEPGRYFVESAFSLITTIHSKKSVLLNDEKTGSLTRHNMYYIDDGVFGAFACNLFDKPVEGVYILNKVYKNHKLFPSIIWGPTMDPIDVISTKVWLPDMSIGDYMVFENLGAYGPMWGTNFNGFPLPKVKCICDKSNWQILRNAVILSPNTKSSIYEVDDHNKFVYLLFAARQAESCSLSHL